MSGPPAHRSRAGTVALAVAVAAALVLALAAQLALAGTPGAPQLGWMVFDGATGAVYAVCAALVRWLSPRAAPAWVMVAASLSWSAGTLGLALQPVSWVWVPLAAGQGWIDALAPWLALAHPQGRLGDRFSRAVVAGLLVLYGARALLRLFVVDAGSWGWCDCVANPLAVGADPGLALVLEARAGQWAHALLFVLVLVGVLVRWARSSAPQRRVAFVMPVAVVLFCGLGLAYDVQLLLGYQVPGADTQFLWPVVATAVPAAYVAGLLHLREMRGRVVDLVAAARDRLDPSAWQEALATAVADPRLRVLWWDDRTAGFRDSDGHPADPGATGAGLARLPVGPAARPVALVLHDPALAESRPLLESVAASLLLAIENGRLTRDLRHSLQTVQESRARLVEAGDAARRRIERDLHDGSQQVLVSLALSLRLAAGRARSSGDPDLAGQLDDAGEQLSRALAELRELARGIHPSVLTEGGLRPALDELAARCPLAVEVDARLPGAVPDVLAATVYFTVAEALTNAAKHSGGSTCTVVVHQVGDRLEVAVSDDGSGGADASGSGLRGVADRVEAVGGRLQVTSAAGRGTRVAAVVPVGPVPAGVPEPRSGDPRPLSAPSGAGP